MTIREYLKIDSLDRDLETGVELSHNEKYGRIISAIGLNRIVPLLPASKDEIKRKIKSDVHLNNIPLSKWAYASGYSFNDRTGSISKYYSPLWDMLRKLGIDSWSFIECVCILKEAARIWAEEA